MDYIDFKCKMDIIEYLYDIKETFQYKVETIDNKFLSHIFDIIEKEIPKNKFYDVDVKELSEEVAETIFDTYALHIKKFTSIVRDENLIIN